MPQGRCTLMCSSVTWGDTVFSFATSRLSPLASFCRDTNTASCVATTTRSSTPSSATSARSVATLQLWESSNTAAPCAALPSVSLSDSSQRRLLHHCIVDRGRLRRGKGLRLQRDKSEVTPGIGNGVSNGRDTRRIEFTILVEQE